MLAGAGNPMCNNPTVLRARFAHWRLDATNESVTFFLNALTHSIFFFFFPIHCSSTFAFRCPFNFFRTSGDIGSSWYGNVHAEPLFSF